MSDSLLNRMRDTLEKLFPEREIYVRSNGSVRYLTLSPKIQIIGIAAALGVGAWVLTTMFGAVANTSALAFQDKALVEIREEYERRVSEMQDRYQRLHAELEDSERRLDEVIRQATARRGKLESNEGVEVALQGQLDVNRRRLREVTAERDETLTRYEEMRLKALEMERKLAEAQRAAEQRRASLDDFVATLDETVGERDEARARVRTLSSELSTSTRQIEDIRRHQAQVMAQLGEATEASIGELERILKRAGVDIDKLVKDIERTYSGEGGPFVPIRYRMPDGARGFPVNEDSIADALDKLQRVNSLRIALERLPLGKPLRDTYRFTSGFGPRRHPVTKRWTAHHGVDMAAPRGTKIYSPVDGVVTFAGRQGGYGKVVKIRHALGYETVYAHLNEIHVQKRETVTRGHHIGDVGNTGRSTGDHLHYEVRHYRKPLNPVRFFKAGENVF